MGLSHYLQINSTTGIIYYHGTGGVLKGYYITNGHIEDGSVPGDQPILSGSYRGLSWRPTGDLRQRNG